MKKLTQLFLTFLKIGAFTFGGGYAMIALLENEFIEKKKWIDRDEFLNMVAVAESTPGPVAVNSATYLGYRVGGVAGAALSTLAVSIPSFVIIYLISLFFDKFLSFTYVAYAFKGIQVCVVYLIASAGVRMFKGLEKNVLNYTILGTVIVVMIVFSITAVSFSSIFYIVISGAVGWMAYMIEKYVKNSSIKNPDVKKFNGRFSDTNNSNANNLEERFSDKNHSNLNYSHMKNSDLKISNENHSRVNCSHINNFNEKNSSEINSGENYVRRKGVHKK